MAYTTIDDPTIYFNTKLYTGNATNPTTISGIGFQPDWVWTKGRDTAEGHRWCDSVRGATKDLLSNTTSAESTNSIGLKSFNSDGYVIGNSNGYNKNSQTFVSWNWKAETSFTNDASGTGIGSIDSAGSVNNDAGFSIVSYTGTGSNGTVKHGLSTVPKMIIYKRRNSTSGWPTWHTSIGTNILELNETGASQNGSTYINGTVPTSSVFSIGTSGDINASGGTYIAYCFADVQGYSKFSSYIGNANADGTFVYTGFKPAFVIAKLASVGGENWYLWDNKRSTGNVMDKFLYANLSNTEVTSSSLIDFLSNGFKLRTAGDFLNANGETHIYMAFAENPFVTSTGVPATAR